MVTVSAVNLTCSFNFCLTGIDLIGPLKECDGKKYIATAVFYFMKFVEAKAIPSKTGEEVGLFIYELFSRYEKRWNVKISWSKCNKVY